MANVCQFMSEKSFNAILPIFKQYRTTKMERADAEKKIKAILEKEKRVQNPVYTTDWILEIPRDLIYDPDAPPSNGWMKIKAEEKKGV